jgi:hypothetical protein
MVHSLHSSVRGMQHGGVLLLVFIPQFTFARVLTGLNEVSSWILRIPARSCIR